MFNELADKINSETSELIVKKVIKDNEKNFKMELGALIDGIKMGNDRIELFEKLNEKINNKYFIKIVKDIILSNLVPYDETKFLREITLNKFKSIVEYILENAIINAEKEEVIIEKLDLIDHDNFICILKFVNTITDWIIVRRYTHDLFAEKSKEMFNLDNDKIEILWQVYNKKKQDLVNITLLNSIALCKSIKSDISKLVEVFSDIFDEDEHIEEDLLSD